MKFPSFYSVYKFSNCYDFFAKEPCYFRDELGAWADPPIFLRSLIFSNDPQGRGYVVEKFLHFYGWGLVTRDFKWKINKFAEHATILENICHPTDIGTWVLLAMSPAVHIAQCCSYALLSAKRRDISLHKLCLPIVWMPLTVHGSEWWQRCWCFKQWIALSGCDLEWKLY